MNSPSAPSSPSPATLESPISRRLYQRRVTVTLTRIEAELLRTIALRVGADKYLAAAFCDKGGRNAVQRRASSIWKKVDRQIERRDAAMRQKVQRAEASLDSIDLLDVQVDLGDRPLLDLDPNRLPEENY